jgi:hypothetical protein
MSVNLARRQGHWPSQSARIAQVTASLNYLVALLALVALVLDS